jgi:PleD family two-component response regulator
LSLDSGPCPEPPPETADAQRTRLAGVLDSALRVIDRRYRVGANEFALILPETRARAGLVAVRRIENAARDVGAGPVTAGLAEVGPGIDQRQLFRNAYCALLSAGREGRSTALVYSPELDRSGSRGATLQGLSEIEPV